MTVAFAKVTEKSINTLLATWGHGNRVIISFSFSLTFAVDVERDAVVDPRLKEPMNMRTTTLFSIEEKLVFKCVCLHQLLTSFGPIIKKVFSYRCPRYE